MCGLFPVSTDKVICGMYSFEEAELMARRSLVIRERSFGSDDPLTACSLDSLALLLKDANQLNEAETMCRKCIDIRCSLHAVSYGLSPCCPY